MTDNLKNTKNGLKLIEERSEVILSNYQLSLPLGETRAAKQRRIAKKSPVKPARRAGVSLRSKKPTKPALQTLTLPLPQKFSDRQVSLFETRLQAHVSKKISVIITDNRSSMISVKIERGIYKVRLHHMFLKADPRILKALGRYIEKADAASSSVLEAYIDENAALIREDYVPAKRKELVTKGEIFDLQELFNYLNAKYFNGSIKADITWGKTLTAAPKHHRSVKMGTYSVEDKIIKIHRALDRNFIPRYFIESIIFHEMLHQVFGVTVVNGKKMFHPPEFQRAEKRFEHYHLARNWEKQNITRLLYF